jgi:hypothetical protein
VRRTFIAVIILAVLLATVGAAQAKKGFYGVVEVLPPGGLVGEWVISGVPVLATPATKLKFTHWPPFVGAWVKVEGFYDSHGSYVARSIKEKKPKKKW